MSRQVRSSFCAGVVAVTVVSVLCVNAIRAQSPPILPTTDEAEIEVPSLKSIPVLPPANSEIQQKIRTALDGDTAVTDGDPVLDDLLQLIRRKGSVLDGTILDPANEPDTGGSDGIGLEVSTPSEIDDAHAIAAESLLRSARLLSRLGTVDPARRELIARMRREAAKLLTP